MSDSDTADTATADTATVPTAAPALPRTPLELFQEYGTPVYPGHPVALACYALAEAETIGDALVPAGPNASTLRSAKTVTGAHDAVQATAGMLGRLQRGEALDAAVKWADEWWARCIRGHKPAFDKRLEPGLEQARRMEALFRERVQAARARAAELAAEPAAQVQPPPPAADPEAETGADADPAALPQ